MQSPHSIQDDRPVRTRSFGVHSTSAYAGEMRVSAHGGHSHIIEYTRDFGGFSGGFESGPPLPSRPKSKLQGLPDHLLRLVNAVIVGTSFALTMAIAGILSYFILSCYGVF